MEIYAGSAARLLKFGSPTEMFAVRYTLAHRGFAIHSYKSLSHKPGSVSDIVNKSHLVAITDSHLCVLRQLSSSL